MQEIYRRLLLNTMDLQARNAISISVTRYRGYNNGNSPSSDDSKVRREQLLALLNVPDCLNTTDSHKVTSGNIYL